MIKAFLLTTALVSWPIISMAQDTPTPPAETPPADASTTLPKIIAKVCLVPVNEKLSNEIKKNFSLVTVYDTPLSDAIFIRNFEFESKVEDHGTKAVFLVSTIFNDHKPVTECVSSYGQYATTAAEKMKKVWEEKSTSAPTDDVPKGPVPAPTFKDDPSSDD